MILWRTYSFTEQDKDLILNAIKEKQKTASSIAYEMQISRQYLNQIIEGIRKVPIERIIQLQTILGIKFNIENEY